jgi:hypothetical protein
MTVMGSFERDVICAHLAAEGILYEVRGSTGGPYRLSVGPMAAAHIYVPESEYETARLIVETRAGDLSSADTDDVPDRAELEAMTGIPLPPAGPVSRNDDEAEMSDAYLRSARPDSRPDGPPRPTRHRRAIH